jgi:phospholipase D-like protein
MSVVHASNGRLSVSAYRGDAKTLLAFDVTDAARHQLAGFTIQVKPPGVDPFYIWNTLRFAKPADHAQDPNEPANSSVNAPIHKFRWVHVPGQAHQGLSPEFGTYRYTVTPRYFANATMTALEDSLAVSVDIDVEPFVKGSLQIAFTRGFTQSQAFVRHFGIKAPIQPKNADLLFDTSQQAGTNDKGEQFTFAQEYDWLGFTARKCILDLLQKVVDDSTLSLDVFAYDLGEPDVMKLLIQLGADNRARIILDNAALHHNVGNTKREDLFQLAFVEQAGAGAIKRGKFGRYAHDKVFIVSDATGPKTVLTGSTNFSVTGLYVNSNHVMVFDDRDVADTYAEVFQEAWNDDVHIVFADSQWAQRPFEFGGPDQSTPQTSITFSPHRQPVAQQIIDGLTNRVEKEGQQNPTIGSVLFAVMELQFDNKTSNPVYEALDNIHTNQSIFSFGISDSPQGISLYPIGSREGVLVTGKPVSTQLPKPFSQVPGVGSGHQVHHKFVVCGFNGPDPVVYCGSSNLALKGEQVNGDNLLAISDGDVATVFAIEALLLVDHFNFLDKLSKAPKAPSVAVAAAAPEAAAENAEWFLGTTDAWTNKYFDPNDLHFVDRQLFAQA